MSDDWKLGHTDTKDIKSFEHGTLTLGSVGKLDGRVEKAVGALSKIEGLLADLETRLAKIEGRRQ